MAFTHASLPVSKRIVMASMDPMDALGDAMLKYFLAAKMYGCTHPLCPRSLHEATSHVAANYSFGLAAVRHGWHRLLRTGCANLNDNIVNYVRSIKNAEYRLVLREDMAFPPHRPPLGMPGMPVPPMLAPAIHHAAHGLPARVPPLPETLGADVKFSH
ncbi:hypothetical protein HPB52_020944 [Rhipicephalus sanguineus]|uniref:RNase III domain-containing protein n=1 Tax=Rhipicephalus sanguineus TaxID=34632 RepID=A0A9D4T4W2_RHISA|nr:hypothetical protein HPB52_020944 [Rhipicephalus sanguineus]